MSSIKPVVAEFRPFHETIVEAICGASHEEMDLLETLLSNTKIPANHRKIIEAWRGLLRSYHIPDDDYRELFTSLNHQWKLAKEPNKKNGDE